MKIKNKIIGAICACSIFGASTIPAFADIQNYNIIYHSATKENEDYTEEYTTFAGAKIKSMDANGLQWNQDEAFSGWTAIEKSTIPSKIFTSQSVSHPSGDLNLYAVWTTNPEPTETPEPSVSIAPTETPEPTSTSTPDNGTLSFSISKVIKHSDLATATPTSKKTTTPSQTASCPIFQVSTPAPSPTPKPVIRNVVVEEDENCTQSDLQKEIKRWSKYEKIIVLNNSIAIDGKPITIPSGKHIVLRAGASNIAFYRNEAYIDGYMFVVEKNASLIFDGSNGNKIEINGNNVAATSGAILNKGQMVANSSSFIKNVLVADEKTNSGAAIYNIANSYCELYDCIISNNVIKSNKDIQSFGAGIYADTGTQVFIKACRFFGDKITGDNKTSFGAAMSASDAFVMIEDETMFMNNTIEQQPKEGESVYLVGCKTYISKTIFQTLQKFANK